MDALLTVLFFFLLLFPVILIIGLIKPKRILRWSKKPTRLKIVGWWFLALLLYFIVVSGLIQLADSLKAPAEIISESETEITNGRYNTAIRRLGKIAPEDPHYTQAQELISRIDSLTVMEVISKATKEIAEEKYDVAIRRLEKITPTDSLYSSSLLNRAKMLLYLKQSNLMVLIVTNIVLDGRQIIFKFSDEKYNNVEMSKNVNQWFNNVSSISVTIPQNTMFTGDGKGNSVMIGKALLEFSINGENYSWDIGKFSELIVQKTDRGPCTLYPEETLKFFRKELEK